MGLWNLYSSSTSTIFISVVTLYKLLNLWEDSISWLPSTKNIIPTSLCKKGQLITKILGCLLQPNLRTMDKDTWTAKTLYLLLFLFFLQDAPAYLLHRARNKAINSFPVLCLIASATGKKTNYSTLWALRTQEKLSSLAQRGHLELDQ